MQAPLGFLHPSQTRIGGMTPSSQRSTIMTLADAYDPRKNSIDFLRFTLAFLVIVTHGFWLSGQGSDPLYALSRHQDSLGPAAVLGFFTLSGFLITRSSQHSSFWRYLWHRSLRILPGFWV